MIEKLKLGNEHTFSEVEDKINEIIDFINSEEINSEENEPIYISNQMINDIIDASTGMIFKTILLISTKWSRGTKKDELKRKGYRVEE